MKYTQEILEKIDRFTKGQMHGPEKAAFEAQLATDPELQRMVEISRVVDEMVVGHEAWKLREMMQKDLKTSRPGYARFILPVVLLLVGVFYYVMNVSPKQTVVEPNTTSVKTEVSAPAVIKEKTAVTDQAMPVPAAKDAPTAPKTSDHQFNRVTPDQEVSSSKEMHLPAPPAKIETAAKVPTLTLEEKNVPALPLPSKNPCAGFRPEIKVDTKASCRGEETGEVHLRIARMEGGQEPFLFHMGDRTSQGVFNRVPAGIYDVSITDVHGCKFIISPNVEVKEQVCRKNNYAYNPQYDPSWSIPYNVEKSPVSFRILDKGGAIFYQTAVHSFTPATWNGESSSGHEPGVGLYFYIIEYADGSMEEGTILISR